jgi:hypothetical protein
MDPSLHAVERALIDKPMDRALRSGSREKAFCQANNTYAAAEPRQVADLSDFRAAVNSQAGFGPTGAIAAASKTLLRPTI